MQEEKVREHVRKLRRFYVDLLVYGVVNLFLILVWALSGGGYFWPIWVIIGWGVGIGYHAFTLNLIPQMTSMIPFMTPEWEDKEVQRIVEERYGDETTETPAKKSSSTKKRAAPKKAPAKKTVKKVTPKAGLKEKKKAADKADK